MGCNSSREVRTDRRRVRLHPIFTLYYQSKINLGTGKISGAEALLRWIHPEWGVILPERFVQIAEECGFIRSLLCITSRKSIWEPAKFPVPKRYCVGFILNGV